MSAYRLSAVGYRYVMHACGPGYGPLGTTTKLAGAPRSLPRLCALAVAWASIAWLAGSVPAVAQPLPATAGGKVAPSLRARVLAEEDARSTTPLAILQALKGDNAEMRRVAVRALGRLEQPDVSAVLVHFLADPEASVRVEAANALAQSVFATKEAAAVTAASRELRDRLRLETHPLVRGALALSLARLHYPSDEAGREAAGVVFDVAFPKDANGARVPASPAVLVNGLRGLLHAALARGLPGTVTRERNAPPVTWLSDEARRTLAAFVVPALDCRAAERATGAPDTGASGTQPSQLAACPAAGPTQPAPAAEGPDARVRRQALAALAATRTPDTVLALALLWDADEQMRSIAARWALDVHWNEDAERDRVADEWARRFGMSAAESRAEVSARAQAASRLAHADPSAFVRYEAVRGLTRPAADTRDCATILASMDDASPTVAEYAMANAYLACGTDARIVARLDALTLAEPAPPSLSLSAAYSTSALPSASPEARRYAAALLGYARVAPATARARVMAALNSRVAPVRRGAATAAGNVLQWSKAAGVDAGALREAVGALVDDADVNVATEAVHVLASWAPDTSRAVFLRALRRADEGLVLEAANALRVPDRSRDGAAVSAGTLPGARDPEVAGVALDALTRLTAAKRETSRDTRLALVALVKDTGDAGSAERLAPWLQDFDPPVAAAAADAIAALRARPGAAASSTGAAGSPGTETAPRAVPSPLRRLPLPSDTDLARMATVRVAMTIKGRGTLVIKLRPDEAPLNAFRFLRLAEQGYYTGLTFHRLVPNFIVQGGSPHGNEYSGDASFSRDEVGLLSNLRGTVGLSTRGRDTGDAQFYVNLMDNVRLDHTYTVFALVESGMDVADALVEGDVIEKVEIRGL